MVDFNDFIKYIKKLCLENKINIKRLWERYDYNFKF